MCQILAFRKRWNKLNVMDRAQLLMQTLLKPYYVTPMLKSSLQKLYGSHHNLVDRNEISISLMTSFTFYVDRYFPLSLQLFLPDLTVYIGNTADVL